MPSKQIQLFIPDTKPYDVQNNWFETFAGTKLIPLIEKNYFKRFWFSRYGAVGSNKNILFRFEVDGLPSVESDIKGLLSEFPNSSYDDYDYATDIGKGHNSRFLGINRHQQDPSKRGDIAFDFLHASARLFLDCITGPDESGYWKLEPETTSGYSLESSMEQFHHLFCNLTGAPTFIAIVTHPNQNGKQVMTYQRFKELVYKDDRWQMETPQKVTF